MQESFFDVELNWAVDTAGMQLIGPSPHDSGLISSETRIIGKGGPLRKTTPAKIDGLLGLFLKIQSANEMLNFCNLYGPLTYRGFTPEAQVELRGSSDLPEGDELSDWLDYASWLRDLRSKSRSAVAKALKRWPDEFFKTVIRPSSSSGLRLVMMPDDLLGLLRIRFAQSLFRGEEFVACSHCGELFQRGPGSSRRADAMFCSEQHKIKHHSLARSR